MYMYDGPRYDLSPEDEARFMDKVCIDPVTGCWIWTARRNNYGYGHFKYQGRPRLAHRVSFEHFNKIKATNILDHIVCDNRACVNPNHVIISTSRANTLRSPKTIASINAAKEVCPKCGKPYNRIQKKDGKVIRRNCGPCKYKRDRLNQMRKRMEQIHGEHPQD